MPIEKSTIITEINDVKEEKDVDERVDKFVEEFHEHGLGCGNKIATLAKEMHPDAIAIIPLYRSCIVIEQSDNEKKEGLCILHGYADPHWLGGDIDIENLQRSDFHARFIVQGRREGPGIYLENADKDPDDKSLEDEHEKDIEDVENEDPENECAEKGV